jgi:hypothetical protein
MTLLTCEKVTTKTNSIDIRVGYMIREILAGILLWKRTGFVGGSPSQQRRP